LKTSSLLLLLLLLLLVLRRYITMGLDSYVLFCSQQSSVWDLAKLFLTSKFLVTCLFSNPTHKTKIGTAKKWETTLVSTLANSTLIILSSELLKISKNYFFQIKIDCEGY
jgi:hypothetical protein